MIYFFEFLIHVIYKSIIKKKKKNAHIIDKLKFTCAQYLIRFVVDFQTHITIVYLKGSSSGSYEYLYEISITRYPFNTEKSRENDKFFFSTYT